MTFIEQQPENIAKIVKLLSPIDTFPTEEIGAHEIDTRFACIGV